MNIRDQYIRDPESWTSVLSPAGKDMQSPLLEACAAAKLQVLADAGGADLLAIPTLQLLLVLTRTADVIPFVQSNNGSIGITSTAFVTEQQWTGEQVPLPVQQLVKEPKEPVMMVGTTPWLRMQIAKPTVRDLETRIADTQATVYTSYPKTTAAFLADVGATDVSVQEVRGKTENRWTVDPKNTGIIDICDTGRTARANGINFIATVPMPVTPEATVAILNTSNSRDLSRLQRFIDILQRAARKRGY